MKKTICIGMALCMSAVSALAAVTADNAVWGVDDVVSSSTPASYDVATPMTGFDKTVGFTLTFTLKLDKVQELLGSSVTDKQCYTLANAADGSLKLGIGTSLTNSDASLTFTSNTVVNTGADALDQGASYVSGSLARPDGGTKPSGYYNTNLLSKYLANDSLQGISVTYCYDNDLTPTSKFYITFDVGDGNYHTYSLHQNGFRYSDFDSVDSVNVNSELVSSAYLWKEAADADGAIAVNTAALTGEVNVIPEPATATLSLLALAGLAARRRRK